MTARLTVLGGSSPSTAALIEALAVVNGPPFLSEITLYGRDAGRLDTMARFARARLGRHVASVRSSGRLEEALDGATLVLSQIRYGGLAGRAADEAFAEAFGLAADETLGPAALRCALRIAPALADLGRALHRFCPDARVINLINPLSVSTAILVSSGARCVGVCELPLVTAREAARALAVPFASLDWTYSGLNHRGFIHRLTIGGRDQLPRLLAPLGKGTLNGISRRVIEELGAIPLKHFQLLQPGTRPAPGRAAFLSRLGSDVFRELDATHTVPPPSLARRDARWYPDAVVPAIVALTSITPQRLVMNVPRDRDVVVEVKADVSADAVVPVAAPRPNDRVAAWLDRFERHERAVLRAVAEPEVDSLLTALDADPMLTNVDVAPIARALCGCVQEESTPSWAFV